MKLPLSWLADWVALPSSAAELSARLTAAGFEVEGLEAAAPPFEGVVVARIESCAPHPEAQRLQVCSVDDGSGQRVQIVCGAANARAGLLAPLARVGATLPGDVRIAAAKLRGVESQGMLCSARELGLAESSQGLLELPADARPGTSLREYLQLDDSIIEIKVYPNRGDALSVLGIAREVAAITGGPVTGPSLQPVQPTIDRRFPVRVDAPECAPVFVGRVLAGLDNRAPTPQWMRERLRRAGLRSISAVVDVTNYVMLELGQPMHAYDLSTLRGEMIVRLAEQGEPLTLLDDRTVTLDADMLVIADRERAIGLAGIMGGKGTSIGEDAKEVFLEVACFTPDSILGRARRVGLATDASQRFERGVDFDGPRRAVERATALLLQICGGHAGPVEEQRVAAFLPERTPLRLRRERLLRLIGSPVTDAEVEAALGGLGLAPRADADGWTVTPPSWRYDLALEQDLVEEVLRQVGFDRVQERPSSQVQRFRPVAEARPEERAVLDALVARGYHEVITYAFTDPALQRALFPDARPIVLANPIAADLAHMRVSLWPGLLRTALENRRRQHDRVRLFELAAVYLRGEGATGGIVEKPRIAGLVLGSRRPEQWGTPTEPVDFHDLKNDVEGLLGLARLPEAPLWRAGGPACLHPGRAAEIVLGGEVAGSVGELHPALTRELGFPSAPLLFELDLNVLLQGSVPRAVSISRFPHVRRDLAVTVPVGTRYGALRDRVSVAGGPLLRELRAFDVYQGPGIESGRKSIALGLIFQDNNRTLTDEEADALMARIASDLQENLGAKLRD
jgi:phenylalanyl-tRNA synthetase beta chain